MPQKASSSTFVGVRSEYLSSRFPEFKERLEDDAVFSLNSFWDWEEGDHYIPAARVRQGGRLRYLCACYTDLDFYKYGCTFGDVIGTVIDLQETGCVPPASLMVRSGRGIWLIWLLRDPKDIERPPRAFPEKRILYTRIQDAIHKAFAHLGADAAAKDAMRLIRVPGSMHSVAGLRTRYWVQANEHGVHKYTLPELADRFGVEAHLAEKARPRAVIAGQSEAKKRGPAALTAYRLSDLLKLQEIRGGFRKGCRNHAALLYAWTLKCRRLPIAQAALSVQKLGQSCHPPLSPSECRGALKNGYNRSWQSYIRKKNGTMAPVVSIAWQTFGDLLSVTPEEARLLKKIPPAQSFGIQGSNGSTHKKVSRAAVMQLRRTAIGEIVRELSGIPTVRKMVELLRTRKLNVSHVTVHKDYSALGLSPKERLLTKFAYIKERGAE